ncbi:hypothetical protein F7725_002802, partial [Dissostichus mawsoni]
TGGESDRGEEQSQAKAGGESDKGEEEQSQAKEGGESDKGEEEQSQAKAGGESDKGEEEQSQAKAGGEPDKGEEEQSKGQENSQGREEKSKSKGGMSNEEELSDECEEQNTRDRATEREDRDPERGESRTGLDRQTGAVAVRSVLKVQLDHMVQYMYQNIKPMDQCSHIFQPFRKPYKDRQEDRSTVSGVKSIPGWNIHNLRMQHIALHADILPLQMPLRLFMHLTVDIPIGKRPLLGIVGLMYMLSQRHILMQ